MKTTIYYFTGTGNSLAIAREVAKNIPESRLERIKYNTIAPKEAMNIGIVFPVYSMGVPGAVKQFIGKLSLAKDTYIFAVATCGGSLGHTFKVIERSLAKNDLHLSAAFSVIMPDNFIPFFNIPSESEQKQILEKIKNTPKTIADCVNNNIKIPIPKTMGIIGAFVSNFIYPIALKHFVKADKKFWSNEKCDGCSICAKVCPVKNIKIENNKPIWQHHCEFCLACLHWCPQQAIQYGKINPKRGRYHHPEVTLKDMTVE
jgi:ferredoxin